MVEPGRKYDNGSAYRYGFNGKEKDKDITLGDLDFGARIYDGRLGRWLSVDPLQKKFPFESPYIFCGNSPISAFDEDGQEKIVITGGADLHNKNRMNFLLSSATQLRMYYNQVIREKSKEKITWVVFDLDYNASEKKYIDNIAKKYGLGAPIFVKTVKEVTNYINFKTTHAEGLIPTLSGGILRSKDPISNASSFSHGVNSAAAFGYENTGWNGRYNDERNLSTYNVGQIGKWAFKPNSEFNLYSCNSANCTDDNRANFNSKEELLKSAFTKGNLVQALSVQTGGTVTGHIGQTSYSNAGNDELPKGASTGGDFSPHINGKEVPTMRIKCVNGKCSEY